MALGLMSSIFRIDEESVTTGFEGDIAEKQWLNFEEASIRFLREVSAYVKRIPNSKLFLIAVIALV